MITMRPLRGGVVTAWRTFTPAKHVYTALPRQPAQPAKTTAPVKTTALPWQRVPATQTATLVRQAAAQKSAATFVRAWSIAPKKPATAKVPMKKNIRLTAGAKADPMAAYRRVQAIAAEKARDAALTAAARIAKVRAEAAAKGAKARAEQAAAKVAEQEKAARIKAHTGAAPTSKAGLREWEAYYQQIGRKLPERSKAMLVRGDKARLYTAVAGKTYVSREAAAASGVGTRPGITWMFQAAYGGGDMPYWDLWYDRKATAEQIGRMVAADYGKEIMRRVGLRNERNRAQEVWEDTGRQGQRPTIDPRAQPGASQPLLAPVAPRWAPPILERPTLLAPAAIQTRPADRITAVPRLTLPPAAGGWRTDTPPGLFLRTPGQPPPLTI